MKLKQKQYNITLFILLAIWLVAMDRVFKSWAAQNLILGEAGYHLGPIDLTLVHNLGAAFGMGQGSGMIFVGLAAVIVIAIFVWVALAKKQSRLEIVALSMIAAGGIGNCIDRLTTGYVVDFIQFTFIDFPVFNIADICITVGVALLLCSMFLVVRGDKEQIKAELDAKTAAERERKKAEEEAKKRMVAALEPESEDAEWDRDVAQYEQNFEKQTVSKQAVAAKTAENKENE